MTYALGLDFGTTFTAAAVEQNGVVRIATLGNRAGAVPAAVFVRTDGSLLHGEDAFLRGASEPLRLVRNLKRQLGESGSIDVDGERLDSIDLVADHLRWAVDRVAEREGGPPDRLVLSHPASWRSSRLEGFRQAIERAGLEPELLTEPHAAAMFHAEHHPLAVGDLVAAYDLGGGTFDAAVLRRTRHGFELAGEPEGEDRLGGIDFDDVVFHLVQSTLGDQWNQASASGGRSFETAVAGLRRECVTAKETLSVEESVDVPVMLPGIMAPVVVTRRDFEHLIRPAVEESIGSFRRAVDGAGASVTDLSAVLLVGGSCRLPIVRDSIEAAVGDGVTLLDSDPKHAVARGAALVAGELSPGTPVVAVAPPAAVAMTTEPVVPSPPEQPTIEEPPSVAAAVTTAPAAPSPPVQPTVEPPLEPVAVAAAAPSAGSAGGGESDGFIGSTASKVLMGAAALVILLGAVGFFASRGGDDEADDQIAIEVESAGASADDQTAAGDPADDSGSEGTDAEASVDLQGAASAVDMGAVPAGTYELGSEDPGAESVAAFSATVGDFHMDLYEVTNAQYLQFVQQIGAPPPLTWDRGSVPEGLDEHPVAGVEFVWADAYCGALGKRLPSDAEWEVAARGPEGALYPTGDDPEGLDLETEGSRPVGSTPANVSAFGIYDAVGSVWEWVGEPYEPIAENERVRRGGQYGRVRDGAAMRQVVDPAGQATITETGFRCAADEVSDAVAPLGFDIDHERPSVEDDGGPEIVGPADGTALVNETFDDTQSGFDDIDVGDWRIGYHSPSWYHLEATVPNAQIMSLGGYNLADGKVELSVYIDSLDTEDGEYRYGLVFRSEGEIEEPPPGFVGPPRPSIYYAFVINPRAGVWELLHEDELPQRVQATGPLPEVAVTDPDATDVLGVDMNGQTVILSVNGEEVSVFDTKGFHVSAGNLGLYTETFDETLVHAHFDLLTVDQS